MTKFRLIHLTTSLKTGGAETILVDLISNLDPNFFLNYVIYFHDGPNVKRLEDLGIKTYKIEGLICKYDPIFLIRLFVVIWKLKPHCIHSLLWSANILGTSIAYILKIPIVCALHLATNFESIGKNKFFRNILDRAILPKANKLIAVSNNMVNDLRKNNWLLDHKLSVIQNGIDISNIEKMVKNSDLNRDSYKISHSTFVIGSVGRFIPRKNQLMILQAFSKLSKKYSDICLILVGYGPMESELKNKAFELGIFDKTLFIKSDKACEFYKIFDCFVLTSYNESFGLVILEAMLFGLPCIVTSQDDDHEIISNNYDGYLIKNDDINALYLKLKNLYENRFEAKKIGEKARHKVLVNFNIKNMTLKYCEIFKQFE